MYIYSFWETEKRPGEGRKTSTQHEPEPRCRVGAQGLLAWSEAHGSPLFIFGPILALQSAVYLRNT